MMTVGGEKSGELAIEFTVDAESTTPRFIDHLGGDEFCPAGVPSVRIRFEVRDGRASAFTIHEDKLILKATRASG